MHIISKENCALHTSVVPIVSVDRFRVDVRINERPRFPTEPKDDLFALEFWWELQCSASVLLRVPTHTTLHEAASIHLARRTGCSVYLYLIYAKQIIVFFTCNIVYYTKWNEIKLVIILETLFQGHNQREMRVQCEFIFIFYCSSVVAKPI